MERRRSTMPGDPTVQEKEDDIKALVEVLKQRRKEMNLSLKEIENATSIRMTYLQALEDGEMSKLISPVYAQGFFKQYAAFLGLDGDKMIRENPHIFNRSEMQNFAYGIGTLEVRGHPGAGVKWLPNIFWIAIFLVMLLIAWYLAKFFEIL